MAESEFRQFALPGVLRAIGRKLLAEFLAHFQQDLAVKNLALPSPDLSDDNYFQQLTELLSCEASLPERLTDALFTIEEMASPEGQERLQAAVAHAGLKLTFDSDTSPERMTVQVWLEAPDVLFREHRKQDLARLTSFECFETTVTKAERLPFVMPDQALHALTLSLVQWFAENHRGVHSTRIDFYPRDHGQYWFRVRHGDTCRWTRKIGDQKTEFVRFTVEDEEAILYLAEQDELWISARTEAEVEFYRRQFGSTLRGRPDYFSEAKNYTLQPLQTEGADALGANGPGGIRRTILRQIQITWESGFHEVTTASADDVFKSSLASGAHGCAVPEGATLTRAAFLMRFVDSPRLRAVEICLPKILKLQRSSDLRDVSRWIAKRGLCLPQSQPGNSLSKAA